MRLWLDELLWERGADAPDVLRAKGVLALHGCPQRHVLQAVRPARMGAVFLTVHAGSLLAAAAGKSLSHFMHSPIHRMFMFHGVF